MKKDVEAHDEIRHLVDLMHYDAHPSRVETPEFRHNKEELHRKIEAGEIERCMINNGKCEGQTEIHHFFVEYSEGTAVDWDRVKLDVDIDNPDQMLNLRPLCHKHHMGTGTGIHMISYPAFMAQRYLNQENLDLFESAIAHLKEEKHPNHGDHTHDDHHLVNRKAQAILQHLVGKQQKEELKNPNSIYDKPTNN